jgi:hypothetical protein
MHVTGKRASTFIVFNIGRRGSIVIKSGSGVGRWRCGDAVKLEAAVEIFKEKN